MTDLVALGADVTWPDHEAAAAARAAVDGGHGRLADLTEWLAGVQRAQPPHDFRRMRAVVFGVDEPAPMVAAAADLVGVGVRGVAAAEDAAADALAAGAALADAEVDSGTDLLIVALPNPGSAAAVIVSVLTDTEPVKVLPRGADLDPQTWMDLAVEVRDARRRAIGFRSEPMELLAVVGNSDLAALAGFVLRAAARRTPVLLDGAGALAGALVAYEAAPRAVRWWQVADRCPDPAHQITLTRLAMRPVLDIEVRVGDGLAGLLAVPILRATTLTAR